MSHSNHSIVASRPIRQYLFWLLIGLLIACPQAPIFAQDTTPRKPIREWSNACDFSKEEVFAQVLDILAERFYDEESGSKLIGKSEPWRAQALQATSRDEFALAITEMLATLNASHTTYYSQLDPKYYQLLSIFEHTFVGFEDERFQYDGIGIATTIVDGHYFIDAVFDGFSASVAGLKVGDELLSVEGAPFHPFLSFQGRAGTTVSVRIKRQETERAYTIRIEQLDGRNMFEQAFRSSVRVMEVNQQRIGYAHVWSYAGEHYHELLMQTLLWEDLKDCDALILDFRDGWGGASIEYLDDFFPASFQLESQGRNQLDREPLTNRWVKPVTLLVNRGTRSGKELFAYGFKKRGRGKLVGETTAGAVLAGQPFLLKNGDLLFLAVSKVWIDGEALEGIGVAPDLAVPRPLVSASDGDELLEAAISSLSQEIAPH